MSSKKQASALIVEKGVRILRRSVRVLRAGILTSVCVALLCSCADGKSPEQTDKKSEKSISETTDKLKETAEYEKGYNLPIEDAARAEAVADCRAVMGQIRDIYEGTDKGSSENAEISDAAMLQMEEVIKAAGNPVITSEHYATLENYQQMEKFLKDSEQGKSGSILLYEISRDGSITRKKFLYDGTDMFLLALKAAWSDEGGVTIPYVSCTRVKGWQYTEKGWFCYELCVPEPPEVTEVVDGNCMLRVRPREEKCIELSRKCLLSLGYRGNNLLCSNWNAENMESLDYNGMYEYLYTMKTGSTFEPQNYPNGIPAEEFEGMIMSYLTVTAEQLREWAVFDEEHHTYVWMRLGCGNYSPTFFGTATPEVTGITENKDGTVTLTVDAVCGMGEYGDAAMTHELTMRFDGDGGFKYLGNKILESGMEQIPDYQYRVK